MAKKNPAWGSPAFKRAVRRHDRQFNRKHGTGPKGGTCALVLAVLLGTPGWLVFEAVRGWAA